MTTKEVCEKFNISRARLHQWRRGETSHGTTRAAKLEKDVDWWWDDGKVYYSGVGCDTIKSLLRKDGE